MAQQSAAGRGADATLQIMVLDARGRPVANAPVRLRNEASQAEVSARSGQDGSLAFAPLRAGTYVLSAAVPGLHSLAPAAFALVDGEHKRVELRLEANEAKPASTPGRAASGATSTTSSTMGAAAGAMEFADQPNFTVAGVTDWTAAGGHGSDATLRTSEALTRDSLAVKNEGPGHGAGGTPAGDHETSEREGRLRAAVGASPQSYEANHQLGEFYLSQGRYSEAVPLLQSASTIDAANDDNAYGLAQAYEETGKVAEARALVAKMLAVQDNAELRRLSGDLDERTGDPLAAVHDYEQAARLDPSERNYFAWGSELLLHRAVWQAREVFAKGSEAYPQSARMLTALGAALFAGDMYEQAALRLCAASALNPADPSAYFFLGRIALASPEPLACVEPKLAEFVQAQPGNALAKYYYAMAILKRQGPSKSQPPVQAEELLKGAVAIDPGCAEAYLQLGILSFERQDARQAIAFYKDAIAADGKLSEAHYRLGVAYDRSGEGMKAKEEFQIHDELEQQQASATDRERREVKQFLVVLQGQPSHGPTP